MQVKGGGEDKRARIQPDQDEDLAQQNQKGQIHKHLLMDDHQMGLVDKETQIKLGAFLTNLMCQNLKYKVGRKEFLLLKPQLVRQ